MSEDTPGTSRVIHLETSCCGPTRTSLD
jgi:hypothetical protein